MKRANSLTQEKAKSQTREKQADSQVTLQAILQQQEMSMERANSLT
jgi:hypothetical protein